MESEKVKSMLKEIGKDVVVGGSIVTLAASVFAATPAKNYDNVLRNDKPAIEKTLPWNSNNINNATNTANKIDLHFQDKNNNKNDNWQNNGNRNDNWQGNNGQNRNDNRNTWSGEINFSIQTNQQLPEYNVALPTNIIQGMLQFTPTQGDLITNISIQGNAIANMGNYAQQWIQEGTLNIVDPRTNQMEEVSFAVPADQSFNNTGAVQVVLRSYDNSTINSIEGNYSVTIESGKLVVENTDTGKIRNISYAVEQQAPYPYQYSPQQPIVLTSGQELLVDVLTVVVVVSAIIAGLLESGQ